MAEETNLTEAESDDLLRKEIFAEEESSESGTNDSQEQEEEIEPEEVETTESIESTEEEEPKEKTPEVKPKNKSNVAKILAEKNEYKRQALEAKKEAEELRSQL